MNDFSRNAWLKELIVAATTLSLSLTHEQAEQCLEHCLILRKWNRVHNLTAIGDLQQMLRRHVLDSLAIVPYISHEIIIDVGSGAGFPGIPIAIAQPNKNIICVEANQKKAAFLRQIIYGLKLSNVNVVAERIEKVNLAILKNPNAISFISRAFAKVQDMLESVQFLLNSDSQIMMMKGLYPSSELENLPGKFEIKVHSISVPGLDQQRHLVIIEARRHG